MILSGKINAISVSDRRGVKKKNISMAELKADYGIIGDAHAGPGHRQVSLMDNDAIMNARKRGVAVNPGDFAENITVNGLDFEGLKLRNRLILNGNIILEITQIGKTCNDRCNIFRELGECRMSDKGIFARVIKGGNINIGDSVEIMDD